MAVKSYLIGKRGIWFFILLLAVLIVESIIIFGFYGLYSEIIFVILMGTVTSHIGSKKLRLSLFLISSFSFFFAMVYDPILAPFLDVLLSVNTVKDASLSISINFTLGAVFWVTYFSMRLLIEKKIIEEAIKSAPRR